MFKLCEVMKKLPRIHQGSKHQILIMKVYELNLNSCTILIPQIYSVKISKRLIKIIVFIFFFLDIYNFA